MARMIFRHPNDPPKKEMADKLENAARRKRSIPLYICVVVILVEALWIYKLS